MPISNVRFDQDPGVLITKVSCDLLGITTLDSAATTLIEQIARETVKERIRLARNWSHKCGRSRLSVADVENIARVMEREGELRIDSVDTLNYGLDQLLPVPSSAGTYSFSNADVEVDKEDTETYRRIPRETRLLSYILVHDGQAMISDFNINGDEEENSFYEENTSKRILQKQDGNIVPTNVIYSCFEMFRDAAKITREDQKVGLKPVASEILTLEQQIFMKEIITICMGQDDKKRHEALYTLETDSGLQVFLPHLTERICKSISANISQRCLSLIIYAVRVLRAIGQNRACDMSVTLHDVLPALLSCCLGRNICLRPESDNHWALRDFSSKTITCLIRDHVDKRDGNYTRRRIFNYVISIFKSPTASLPMIYGATSILQDFVDSANINWLLNEYAEMTARCKQYIETNRNLGTIAQESSKLLQLLQKCECHLKSKLINNRK